MNTKLIWVWDLDGTAIDSSHRKSVKPDGTLDLENWIANNTPENIAKDKLLPLAKAMRKCFSDGHTVVICTARVMQDADFEFLMRHGIQSHEVLSRPEGCRMSDHELKDIQLRLYAQRQEMSWAKFCKLAVMVDDAESVLTHLSSIGIRTIDATIWNKQAVAG